VIVWVDAQLSPALAPWITQEFGVEAFSARYLTLVRAKDREIFEAAREADAVVLTKDADFTLWLKRLGPPPRILWLRCGNTSNAYLKRLLRKTFPSALDLIISGEMLVEITDRPLAADHRHRESD
jgi:predicted nuclease of predicted toxin-antitoxin system